jgi:tryptophanyl-tRNA synthetase
MSKSDEKKLSCINLIDDPEIIRMKIQKAKTDSLFTAKDLQNPNREKRNFDYNPERPELANLLRIYAAVEGVDYRYLG